MNDYYKILGISRDASTDEIKRAYRRLAHQHHPDRPGGNEEKFKEINEAYQILSNQEKRRQYDQFGRTFSAGGGPAHGWENGPFGGFGWEFGFDGMPFDDLNNISDIFDTVFEGLGIKRRKTYQRGADLELELAVSLEEAFNGASREISFAGLIQCLHCGGLGHYPEEGFNKCAVCDGRGEIREDRSTFFGNFSQVCRCAKCFGSGQIPVKTCAKCQNSGRIKKQKTISVAIAPGVRDGQIIKIAAAGEAGERGAAAGDLYIRIKVKPHPTMAVRGDDLLMEKELNLIDALLGRKVKIKTLGGKELELEIPAGVSLNKEFRIAGEGMPRLGQAVRGDLYIVFNIKMPGKLSAKVRKILGELENDL